MAERTKEHYEKSFANAREMATTFLHNIRFGEYDNAKPSEQIKVIKRTINEQRADMAQENDNYQEEHKCPEHIAYKEFVATSKEVLDELTNIPVMQADKTIEDMFGGNQ